MDGFRVVVFVFGFLTLETHGATIHVPDDAPTIQIAIALAQPFDTIIVAPGTYHETINLLGKAITVRSSGGPEVTTIDATGLGGSTVTCTKGETPDTVLDGFTITGGTGTVGPGFTSGGGMYNFTSNPTVTNCTFFQNSATFGGGMYNDSANLTVSNCAFGGNQATTRGGGIYNSGSSPTVTNCEFDGNTTDVGGGMFNSQSDPAVTDCTFAGNTATFDGGGMYNVESVPILTRCTFDGNTATYLGGGMYNIGSGPTIVHCAFSGNSAGRGGGMYNYENSEPTVLNCTFGDNAASVHGGGMYNFTSNPSLTDCTFAENSANSNGSGMFSFGSNPTLTRCMFIRNAASGRGGGMHNHGGGPTVRHSTFNGNTATVAGGGIYNVESEPAISDCTFSGNAVAASAVGGGMATVRGVPTLTRCTFTGNNARVGGEIYIEDSFDAITTNCIIWGDVYANRSAPVIRFSDVQGGLPEGTTDFGGNLNLDPMFLRPPDPGADGIWGGPDDNYGDLRLRAGSPCIDTGDPGFVPLPGETDLDGHGRVLGGRLDIGAYEFSSGALYCDRRVTLTDFGGWVTCMVGLHNGLYPDGCEVFDCDDDGFVDLRDFAEFQRSMFGP